MVSTQTWTTDRVPPSSDAPEWRGVHHLAMVTPDMDTTVRFYVGVLGMPLVATLTAGPMRHYFFELGPGNTIAFFEVPGAETFSKPAGATTNRAIQFDHVSFAVDDEAARVDLQRRLLEAGCEVTPVVDHRIIRSIYFHDPNGIALEASWWPVGAAALAFDPGEPDLFAAPPPGPAGNAVAAAGRAADCASQGAVSNLTRAMALDHAHEGIRINAVCPGAVDTHMLYSERSDTVDEVRAANLTTIPEGRIPAGEEVAEVVAFLADDRSRHVNGANLSIDGGYTAA